MRKTNCTLDNERTTFHTLPVGPPEAGGTIILLLVSPEVPEVPEVPDGFLFLVPLAGVTLLLKSVGSRLYISNTEKIVY